MHQKNNTLSMAQEKIIVGRPTNGAHDCQPEVTVEKTGEMISRVLVKCPCGQEIAIDCLYESGEAK